MRTKLFLKVVTDLQAGPMAKREVFKKTTKVLYSVPKEKERENTFIPEDQRTKQRDELEPVVQERREWLSRHWREALSETSTASTSTWSHSWWSSDEWQEGRWQERRKWQNG